MDNNVLTVMAQAAATPPNTDRNGNHRMRRHYHPQNPQHPLPPGVPDENNNFAENSLVNLIMPIVVLSAVAYMTLSSRIWGIIALVVMPQFIDKVWDYGEPRVRFRTGVRVLCIWGLMSLGAFASYKMDPININDKSTKLGFFWSSELILKLLILLSAWDALKQFLEGDEFRKEEIKRDLFFRVVRLLMLAPTCFEMKHDLDRIEARARGRSGSTASKGNTNKGGGFGVWDD